MKTSQLVSAVIVATSLVVGTSAASAQQGMGSGAEGHHGADRGPQGRFGGAEGDRPFMAHMMGHMMEHMAAHMGGGVKRGSMMGQGMMGQGMMGQGIAPGMMMRGMPSRMGSPGGGMAPMFGARVVPMMNLAAEDVRAYFDWRLERLGNKRLEVGDVKAEGDTVTAEIVTVDNSLVQRMKVDRHTGVIDYE